MYIDYGFNAGAFIALAFVWFLILIAAYVIFSWFLMKIFEKAGVQGKWRAWVPIYNTMIFLKLGDLSPWLILIAIGGTIVLGWVPVLGQLIGLAAFLLTLLAAWRVGLKLQKEAVWLILYFFLSIVWYGINAFDKSRWNTAIPAAPWAGNGFLGDSTKWDYVPDQVPAGGWPSNPVTHPAPGQPQPGGHPGSYAPPAAPAAPPVAPPAPPTGAPQAPPATPPAPPSTEAPSAWEPPAPDEPRA